MARTGKLSTRRSAAITAAKGASWMSLVAATTLGVGHVDRVRARISAADLKEDADSYRLIVQSYPKASLAGEVPDAYARPRASAQRAVTLEELQTGVDVSILQLDATESTEDGVVIAWLERGAPDLEYDGRRARPQKDAYYGTAEGEAPQIVLRRWQG